MSQFRKTALFARVATFNSQRRKKFCQPPQRERRMNWDAVAAVANLLGTIGVINTLVYLAHWWDANGAAMGPLTMGRAVVPALPDQAKSRAA
jgi:hypothetical protein